MSSVPKVERKIQSDIDKLKSDMSKMSTRLVSVKQQKQKTKNKKQNKKQKNEKFGQGYSKYELLGTLAPNTAASPLVSTNLGFNTTVAAANLSVAVPVNPSFSQFPLNCTRSLTYDKWRHKAAVRVKYTPSETSYGAVAGNVIFAWVPDASDTPNWSVQYLLDLEVHHLSKVSEGFEFVIPFSKLPKQWMFTRNGDQPAFVDQKLYDTGLLMFTSYGVQSGPNTTILNLGTIEIQFDAEYKDQVLTLNSAIVAPSFRSGGIAYQMTNATLTANSPTSLYHGVSGQSWTADYYTGNVIAAQAIYDFNNFTTASNGTANFFGFSCPPGMYLMFYCLSFGSLVNGNYEYNIGPISLTGGNVFCEYSHKQFSIGSGTSPIHSVEGTCVAYVGAASPAGVGLNNAPVNTNQLLTIAICPNWAAQLRQTDIGQTVPLTTPSVNINTRIMLLRFA